MSTDPSQAKAFKLIDLNLFSGSTDVFRTAVGGYWMIDESDDTEDTSLVFQEYAPASPLSPYFTQIVSRSALKETVSEKIIVPNKRFPIRVYGSDETVLNDKHWQALFVGGEFMGESVSPIYNENVYGYHLFDTPIAYPKKDAMVLEGNSISNQIEISYDYNAYLPLYEKNIKFFESELLIPNFYIISDLQSVENMEDINLDTYDTDIISLVTEDGAFESINTVLDYDFKEYPAKIKKKLKTKSNKDYTFLSTEYLPNYFSSNPLSTSIRDSIKNKLKNIILDDAALKKLHTEDNIIQYAERFPFHVKINFPTDQSSTFVDSITTNKYSSRFLKTIKEVFSGELRALSLHEGSYAINMNYLSSSEDVFEDHEVKTTEEGTYRYVDFLEMLAYNYNNYISRTDNCYYVGTRNIYRDSVFDRNGAYRYMNSISAVKTMNDVIDYLNNESNFDINSLGDFLYQQNDVCYNETLAYRVQKVGGAPRGDAKTQNTLQNYWLLNSKDLEEFDFVDTQVKYGRDYTYHVYKYVVVVGARYKFSNLRITQGISVDNEIEQGDTIQYGLEFYDPKTEEKVEQLFNVEGERFETINPLGTLVQEESQSPYLADFHLNYEPCVFIYEVPIYSKTLKVMDNPPNETDVYPYQHLDDSQKIGFGLYYDAFAKKTFPQTIASKDEKLKQDYMNANDLLSDSKLPHESVSRPRYIQIFRINEMPTSYSDFNNNLIKTLDLRVGDSDETYTVDFFDNKIQTNTKYYYLFRILNEQRMIGSTSEIYETELVSDGGYKYATFNVLYEEDLEKNIFVNPSKKVKKIIQLQPNVSQLMLNTDFIDFEKEANTQVEKLIVGGSDETIWDKKFKVRLTSKKTGRKIDLNITYKLN